MQYFKIDFKRLTRLLTPFCLRAKLVYAFCDAVTVALIALYNKFKVLRNDINYRIEHNSQYCYLEAVLNDSFDFLGRRIHITDTDASEWGQFLYRESENRPVMLYTGEIFMLDREQYIGSDSIDFVVNVPLAIKLASADYTRMRALLNYYKLISKRYIIQSI